MADQAINVHILLCHSEYSKPFAGTGCEGLVAILSAVDISPAIKALAAALLKDFLLPPTIFQVFSNASFPTLSHAHGTAAAAPQSSNLQLHA